MGHGIFFFNVPGSSALWVLLTLSAFCFAIQNVYVTSQSNLKVSFFKDFFRNQVKDSPRGNVWNSRGWPTQMCLAHCVCSRAGGTGSGVLCVDTSRTYGKKRIIKWKRLGKFDRIKPAKKKYTKRTKYILIRAEATIVTQFYSVSPCRFESLARRRHADTHQNSLIMVMDSCPRQKETTWPLQVHVAIEKRPESMIFLFSKLCPNVVLMWSRQNWCIDVCHIARLKRSSQAFAKQFWWSCPQFDGWSSINSTQIDTKNISSHHISSKQNRRAFLLSYCVVWRPSTFLASHIFIYFHCVILRAYAAYAYSLMDLPGTADRQTDPGCHHGRGEGARKSRFHNAHDIGYNNLYRFFLHKTNQIQSKKNIVVSDTKSATWSCDQKGPNGNEHIFMARSSSRGACIMCSYALLCPFAPLLSGLCTLQP